MASEADRERARREARRAAIRRRINPDLFERQIGAESNFDKDAGSPAGAQGVAQFMPGTAASVGVNLHDGRVSDDLDGAAKLMADYLHRYGGSWKKALQAYNAGPGNVGKPLFSETANYIAKILGGRGDAHDSSTSGGAGHGGGPGAPATPVRTNSTVDYGTESVTRTDPELARKQFFAQWLARKKPNSPLIRLGAVDPNMAITTTSEAPVATGITTTTTGGGGRRGSSSSARMVATGAGPQRAVQEAAMRLGVGEVGSSNRGQRLDTWQRKFGMLGQPWCGIFVGLALEKAGVRGITPRVASVAAIEQDARAGKGGFRAFLPPTQARAGDALVVRRGGHVGLVASVDPDGTIHTIEGNTSNGKVQRRTHRPGDVVGVARPRFSR